MLKKNNFYIVPDDSHSSRRLLDDPDTLATLERCFKLIHEQHAKETIELPENSVPGSAASLRTSVTSYLAKFLTRPVFDRIKRRQTRLDHNLFDVIWPAMKKVAQETPINEDLNAGIVIPDFDAYIVFQEFLEPLVKDLHCMDPNVALAPHPDTLFFPQPLGDEEEEFKLDLDSTGKWVNDGVIEVCRNLEDFEMPLNLSLAQLEQVERSLTGKLLSTCFSRAIGEEKVGTYHTIQEILDPSSQIRLRLEGMKLLIPLLNSNDPRQAAESLAINGDLWPYGRGVFVSERGDLAAWINVQDHLRIVCSTKIYETANIGSVYFKLSKAVDYLSLMLDYRFSHFLGFLASRPSFIGSALKVRLTLSLPQLTKEMANLRHLCNVRGLHANNETESIIQLTNMQSLSTTEWRIFQDVCTAIENLLELELDHSIADSATGTLLKIFKKKRNSDIDEGDVTN